jgi:hypothetical protein
MLPNFMFVEKIVEQRNRELEREAQLNLAIRLAEANHPVRRRNLYNRALALLGQKMARIGLDLQARYGEDCPMQTIAR